MSFIAAKLSKGEPNLKRRKNKFGVKYSGKKFISNNMNVLGVDFPNEYRNPNVQ